MNHAKLMHINITVLRFQWIMKHYYKYIYVFLNDWILLSSIYLTNLHGHHISVCEEMQGEVPNFLCYETWTMTDDRWRSRNWTPIPMEDDRVGLGNVALNDSKSSSSTYLSVHLDQIFKNHFIMWNQNQIIKCHTKRLN